MISSGNSTALALAAQAALSDLAALMGVGISCSTGPGVSL